MHHKQKLCICAVHATCDKYKQRTRAHDVYKFSFFCTSYILLLLLMMMMMMMSTTMITITTLQLLYRTACCHSALHLSAPLRSYRPNFKWWRGKGPDQAPWRKHRDIFASFLNTISTASAT